MGCESCKKKKTIKKLPEVLEVTELTYYPTPDEILEAYYILCDPFARKDEAKVATLKKVYETLFDEPFGNCKSCGLDTKVRKMKYHIQEVLKIEVR